MNDLLLITSSAALTAILAAMTLAGIRDQAARDRNRRVMRLRFAPDLEAAAVLAFVRSLVVAGGRRRRLGRGRDSVVFEVIATARGIEHRLHLPERRADAVLGQLRAAVPDIEVEELPGKPADSVTAAQELRLHPADRTLRTDQPASTAAAVLAAFSPLASDETLRLQLVVRPGAHVPAPAGPIRPRRSASPVQLATLVREQDSQAARTRDWREKAAEPLFASALRLSASCPDTNRARALVRRLEAVLHVMQRPGAALRRFGTPRTFAIRATERASTPILPRLVLNASEVAALVAWPIGSPAVAGLALDRSRRLAPAPGVPEHGRVLGEATTAGHRRPIALSAADSLHHVHLCGPTGVGKSTLLANLLTADIAAGRSVVLVDPKGSLVADVLDRIPPERTGDVILLDPTDAERPVGINVLAGAATAPDRVADQVLHLLHRLYAAHWGPRTADILHASLLTLAKQPGATLCDVPLLLSSDGFRRRLIGRLRDPIALEPFWAWFGALSPAERSAVCAPVLNKLRAFLLRRDLRAVIGQAEPTWTMDEVLNQRKVLLVSLARGQLGAETASLIGSLVVATLWQAVQRRTVRLPAMVVLDEFQDVIGGATDLGELLAQARGFGVAVHLAHQHLHQLDPGLRAAVLANARSRVVFQAADDAATLAKQLGGGLVPADLMNLPRHQAYVAPCVGAEVLAPASLRTLPLTPGLGSAVVVRAASRQRYGRDRTAIEAALVARYDQRGAGDEPLGSRRRAS